MTKKQKIKPFTQEQRIFIRKAFMLNGVQNKFNEWFDTNFIYCEGTYSFIHRCFDAFKECKDYREAQNQAFEQLDLMRLEFLYCSYNLKDLKKKIKEVIYISPLDRLKKEKERTDKLKEVKSSYSHD
jgi:hypothetical protein